MKNNIGIAATQPATECNDLKCPWHGALPVRGRVFSGKVVSDKAAKTVIVEWGYYHSVPKYERYERRTTRISAYNPACIAAKTGDMVTVSECRPLSKTKSFVVIEKIAKNKK